MCLIGYFAYCVRVSNNMVYMYMYSIHVHVYMSIKDTIQYIVTVTILYSEFLFTHTIYICILMFLICFEAWVVCAPFGIYLQRINAVSDNIIIITCAIWPIENCAVPNKKFFGPI